MKDVSGNYIKPFSPLDKNSQIRIIRIRSGFCLVSIRN